MAKSSMPSPSRNSSTSYSHRNFYALAILMRSSPMQITLMLSHASYAESFVASMVIISGGTALQIASNAMRSTWNSTLPGSTAAHRPHASILILMSNDHWS
jgi:hypothetical protein